MKARAVKIHQHTVADPAARVQAHAEGKPRPEVGWINGWICLWMRPGDVHCLAAGEVTASVQVHAQEAIQEHLKEPG